MSAQLPAALPWIDERRLTGRLDRLAEIGPITGGGSCRLALTDEDRQGRDLVVSWMHELGLTVSIDAVGNVTGVWDVGAGPPVMTGSHVDTVRTGGRFDGNLGITAGLEVIETLQRARITPSRPMAVAVFTNEEGARFQPDMLGSLVYTGGLALEAALDIRAIDGARLGDELSAIGYGGAAACPGPVPHAYVELHIEQGPVLEAEQARIGVVTGVQGISWQELVVEGQANHAGTTPMHLRHDPLLAAAQIAVAARRVTLDIGGNQVGTIGRVDAYPNLVNVVAGRVAMTVDLRNTDAAALRQAESSLAAMVDVIASEERVTISSRPLAQFAPVEFDPLVIELVESLAHDLGHPNRRMPSGAGHDAQMFAGCCPSGMIFVPSRGGISHNPSEYTSPGDLAAGADVLMRTMLALTER